MKRVHYLTILTLLFFLPNLLSAQLPKGINTTVTEGQGGSASLRSITLEPNCDLTYQFYVVVVNLDAIHGLDYSIALDLSNSPWDWQQSFPAPLALPANYPPMYLECELNGVVETVEADSFVFVFLPHYDSYGFAFLHKMTTNISDQCEGKYSSTKIYLDYSVSLLTETDSIYPICDYTDPGDIFDCNYLGFSGICDSQTCHNSNWATWDGHVGVKCGEQCGDIEPFLAGGNDPSVAPPTPGDGKGKVGPREGEASSEEDIRKSNSLSFEVNPNPFYDRFNINWNSSTKTASTIRLYNASGQVVKSWVHPAHQAGETLIINSHDLPKGIYFLQIQNGTETVHHKLIKA